MSYWSNDIAGNDFAAGSVGVVVLWMKQRMFQELETVIAKAYPEQSVAAHLCCLRLVGTRFRKGLSVHFGRRDLARAREGFDRWYELVKENLPEDRREAVRVAALEEFSLFEALLST